MWLPDAHFPDHHVPSLRCVLKAMEMLRPKNVGILGDWSDCGLFSPHAKTDLDLQSYCYFKDEVEPIRYYLQEFRKHTERIVFLEGNHEFWVRRWLARNAQGRLALSLEKVLPLDRCIADDIDVWVPWEAKGISKYAITPNLWAVHGWSHSKHAAMAHLDKARNLSVIHGHTHREQSYATRLASTDERIVAWSPGCLCNYSPRYLHTGPDGWLRGFSVMYISQSDPNRWTEYTVNIDDAGRATLPDGRQAKAAG